MSETVIKVENLTKIYNIGQINGGTLREDLQQWWSKRKSKDEISTANKKHIALDNVSFEVKQGDIIGIIGRNGAGKSTLLKILSRTTAPSSGTVKIKGRIGSLLEVGTGFHPELSGRDNIYLNGSILGMRKAEIDRKLDEIIDFSGIEKFIDTPVKRYSSGMYVRLAFAVAAHLDPEILIVDEVLAVGDAQFQNKCIGKMKDSSSAGKTVLFVSHQLGPLQSLCTNGIFMKDGRINNIGTISECIGHYLHQSSNKGNSILNYVTKSHENISLNELMINNSSDKNIAIKNSEPYIHIYASGYLKEQKRINLEARITDENGVPLAFFSPWHETGICNEYSAGNFEINESFKLPDNIVHGKYLLNISLTDPNIEGWIDIENGVELEIEGHIGESGIQIPYTRGSGWIILEKI